MTKLLRLIVPVGVVLLASSCNRVASTPSSGSIDSNKYYAVLLNNNAVYFGKLDGLGSAYPVLRDVFYIQSASNPDTKQVSNVLVKRGKELHGPDRMIINERSIVFVEPVGADSKVAQLISEAKR
ncbi:MAG TPA: hypothetical protein VK789_34370 [Bryobacteraceae bacterium]|jgi:hypothetical protein|nr:hypothetical protein [Bryobacteraceae bacterium]